MTTTTICTAQAVHRDFPLVMTTTTLCRGLITLITTTICTGRTCHVTEVNGMQRLVGMSQHFDAVVSAATYHHGMLPGAMSYHGDIARRDVLRESLSRILRSSVSGHVTTF